MNNAFLTADCRGHWRRLMVYALGVFLLALTGRAQTPLSDRTETTTPAAGDYTWWLDADSPGALRKISWANLFKSPTLITPNLGVATATSVNGLTITTSTGTVTITNAKTLSVSNTLTLAGTDGSTLNIGAGGTLGTAAFTASTAYLAVASNLSDLPNAATARTNLGVAIGTDVQAFDSDLLTWAGIEVDPNVPAWLSTPSSLNLKTAVTDETGSGALVFGTSPTISGPTLSGTIAGTYTIGGTPTFPSTVTLDTEWDTIGEIETATSANILVSTEVDTSSEVAGLVTDETGSGALVFGTSPAISGATLTTPTISGAVSFPDGVRQTFNPDGTNAGLNVGAHTADPSAPSNGDLWYDSTNNLLRARVNGATISITGSAGGLASTDIDTSAELRGILTDETGTGAAVFGTSPTISGPTLSGTIAGTYTIGGTPTFPSTVTLDSEWDTIGEIETATSVNILVSTEVDTSSELATLVTDETGSGALVFGTSATLTTPTVSGALTKSGVTVSAGNAMGALAIDVTKAVNTKSISADSTFTFSGTPSSGTFFSLLLTEGGGVARTVTIPSSLSIARDGSAITSFTLAASAKALLMWYYDGTNYILTGEPVAPATSGAYSSTTWNGDTNAPTKDAIRDQLVIGDSDGDGKIDVLDLTAGIVKTDSSGVVSVATAGTDYSTPSSTDTLTNKRVTARVTSISSSATPTVNTDNCDCVTITALAAAITSMTTNLTGTPSNFDQLEYRIKDDGTGRAITWGASFASGTGTLPTTTTASKVLHVWFEWDSVQSKWICLSAGSEP